MRNLTELELDRIKLLTEKSVDICLIEPTKTGLQKSILDATGTVRSYLKERNIHDYDLQKQGPESKIQLNAFFIYSKTLSESIVTLYRPITKNGDPRIWFKGLNDYCKPNDILAIFNFECQIYVLNISKINLSELLNSNYSNPILNIVNEINKISNEVADELLIKLNKIARMGPIPSSLNADTAVGRTLESILGIKINSSKNPDYKGIELKSYRDKRGNRKNLFAQVPNWQLSKFKKSDEILNAFGYFRESEFKLYCTVSAIVRNSQGLILKLDNKSRKLIENSNNDLIGDFVVWDLLKLHERLLEKHSETFWIAADSILINGIEHFQYKKIEHTKKPIVSQFDILLEQGIITVDHLIKQSSTGSAKEKGPLFKIKPNALELLFPPSKIHKLV